MSSKYLTVKHFITIIGVVADYLLFIIEPPSEGQNQD